MSALPTLAARQHFIGIGRPDSYVTHQKGTVFPVTDVLQHADSVSATDEDRNAAFATVLSHQNEIERKAKQEMGKRGLSQQDYEELFWEQYLEHISPDDTTMLWKARSSPRYHLMWNMYHSLKHQPNELFTLTQKTMEVFQRINGVLAIHIINDIAGEVAKRKREKKNITPQAILEAVLSDRNSDEKNSLLLFINWLQNPFYLKTKRVPTWYS